MKNLKSFMLIFSVALILGAVLVGSCSAQTNIDYLKVKGNILNDYEADIYLYVENDDNSWSEVSRKMNKNRYSYRLATNKNYQIVFIGHSAPTKIVHIKSGDPGMYYEFVDIDFTGNNKRHACLTQNNDKGYYDFQTEIEFASLNSKW